MKVHGIVVAYFNAGPAIAPLSHLARAENRKDIDPEIVSMLSSRAQFELTRVERFRSETRALSMDDLRKLC
jgi:hypothetical protein